MKSLIKIALLFFTTLTFIACGGSSGGGSDAPAGGGTTTPATTKLTIVDPTGDEGGMIHFKVTATPTNAKQISFEYRIDFDNPLTPDSASPADLSGQLTGTMQADIPTDDSSVTISIATENDPLREKAESFSVIFSNVNPSEATFGVDNIGRGTILDNDNNGAGKVTISVADATANENAGAIIFQVTSEFKAISPFTFEYETIFGSGSTYASSDDLNGATNGTATIDVDASSTTISIPLKRDATVEENETFSLRLTNPSANVILKKTSVQGTILNDDLGEISNQTAIIGDGKITLNWTNPNSTLFAGVVIAQVESRTAPADCSSGRQLGEVTSDTINLTNGTTHSFRICARSNSSISSGVELADLTLIVVDQDKDGLIEITTATQLNNIRYNPAGTSYKTSRTDNGSAIGCPNNRCSGYELMNDIIDLSSDYNPWMPIGEYGSFRNATFDGNNKTISGLKITGNPDNAGLFSIIQDASIGNLKLATVDIAGGRTVGALVGFATGTLSNIELIGGSIAGQSIGGLVGSFSGSITDSTSSLDIRGGANTGGLVGSLTAGSIKNSNSSGSVSSGANNVGGLVGTTASDTTIDNSWASGNIRNDGGNYGGLVGLNRGNISNSWASGSVSTSFRNSNYGGLVGSNYGNISNSWASGRVFNTSPNVGTGFGGLVGRNYEGTISNSWARGMVSGEFEVGGLVGENNSVVRNIWASGTVSGGISGGLIGANYSGGNAQGRNYKLDGDTGRNVTNSTPLGDGAGNSIHGLTALAALSGASGDTPRLNSDWHAGFDLDNLSNTATADFDDITKYCDTNKNGMIDGDEQIANNSVWVMPSIPTGSDNVPAPDTNGDGNADYYAIPAIRCIGDTKGKTSAQINAIRKANIDQQRLLFLRND